MRLFCHLSFLTSALLLTSAVELLGELDVQDQLIKLRLKEMQRGDRLPTSAAREPSSTSIPIDPELPSTTPGSV